MCTAPLEVAEDLLRVDGFTDVQYLKMQGPPTVAQAKALASGDIDMTVNYGTNMILQIDAGDPVVLLAGVHVGCYELFGVIEQGTDWRFLNELKKELKG
jgi:NitT/TauT family transport system substrate-binding protein